MWVLPLLTPLLVSSRALRRKHCTAPQVGLSFLACLLPPKGWWELTALAWWLSALFSCHSGEVGCLTVERAPPPCGIAVRGKGRERGEIGMEERHSAALNSCWGDQAPDSIHGGHFQLKMQEWSVSFQGMTLVLIGGVQGCWGSFLCTCHLSSPLPHVLQCHKVEMLLLLWPLCLHCVPASPSYTSLHSPFRLSFAYSGYFSSPEHM